MESIRGIRLYNLMLNFVVLLLNFVCVTVCNIAGKHFGQRQLFKCAIEIKFVLYCIVRHLKALIEYV